MKSKISFLYVVINIVVAAIGFLRSFVFMNVFDLKELGTITLINTATVLIGFFQFGIINGGYRLVAINDSEQNSKTNDVAFSYFGVVFILLFILTSCAFFLNLTKDTLLSYIVSCLGIFTIVYNWLTNYMIGTLSLRELNISNLISALISILVSFSAYYIGIYGAILSLISQPLFFIIISTIINKSLIPNRFDFDLSHIKKILELGFIPFLTGVFFLVYMQFERWSINLELGPEELGKLFLFFITVNLWTLIPTSISNLFFPKVIKAYSLKEFSDFKIQIRNYFVVIIIYCLIGGLSILIILKPLVVKMFPEHSDFSDFVILGIPGLFFRTLADPFSLFFNSVLKLNIILWTELISLLAYILFLLLGKYEDLLNLKYFIYAFNFYFILKYILFYSKYSLIKKTIRDYSISKMQ